MIANADGGVIDVGADADFSEAGDEGLGEGFQIEVVGKGDEEDFGWCL